MATTLCEWCHSYFCHTTSVNCKHLCLVQELISRLFVVWFVLLLKFWGVDMLSLASIHTLAGGPLKILSLKKISAPDVGSTSIPAPIESLSQWLQLTQIKDRNWWVFLDSSSLLTPVYLHRSLPLWAQLENYDTMEHFAKHIFSFEDIWKKNCWFYNFKMYDDYFTFVFTEFSVKHKDM